MKPTSTYFRVIHEVTKKEEVFNSRADAKSWIEKTSAAFRRAGFDSDPQEYTLTLVQERSEKITL